MQINIQLKKDIDIFEDKLSDGCFSKYYKLELSIIKIPHIYKIYAVKDIYKYLLVSSEEIIFRSLINKNYYDKYLITKYKPINYRYYTLYETLVHFNILHNVKHNDNILNIGKYTPIEIILNNNYKVNNIDCINLGISYIESTQGIKDVTLIRERFKNVFENLNVSYFNDKIELLLDYNEEYKNKYKYIFYDIFLQHADFWLYSCFHNTINIFVGMLMSLKYTQIGGYFIIYLGFIAYKQTADIYLILKQYFEESNLYYPEISNLYKDNDVIGVFKKFKGISTLEYNNLLEILYKLIKLYPDNLITNFNIYDKEERESFNITKPIDESKREKYITGFLPDDTDYSEIIDFNNSSFPLKLSFLHKMLNKLQHINTNTNTNTSSTIQLPTQDQILSSILYCRKYDIPIFDKYTIKEQDNRITKTILHDLYGLHEPILYKFKTPFYTHIANKIIFNPKFKSSSRTKTKTKTKHIPSLLKTKILSTKKSSISFFNDLFANDANNSSHKSKHTKQSKHKSTSRTKKQSKLKHTNMSLEEAVFNSNNQLVQVGRLIDVRKDFTKSNPTELYDKLKNQLRYYKGWGKAKPAKKYSNKNRTVPDLTDKVQYILKDYTISQAWLKMYEIITECNLIPTNRKGIYKSFHICEAPGTFISCINNYIHTKTSYDSFEWKSQSLNPKGAKGKFDTVSDTYGFIKKYPDKWDFGVDDTGDITNIENIKYYAKMAKDMNINLMTSDCGLPWGDSKYYQVAYASYVSLLYSLPQNGTMLYKILSPIDVPLIWNLIYITYAYFKEMYFFKPVQNSQSREFYIVGKGYLGLEQTILEQLLNLIPKFENPSFNKDEYDLFNDTYPEEFVIQIQKSSELLASNYVNSIERIIYYIDNIDALGKDYQKHIENYMKEKNEDWIRKYKVMKLDKKL